jgi:ribonuclease P protein component
VWKGKHMKITYVRGLGTKDKGLGENDKSQVHSPTSIVLSIGTLASTSLDKSAVKRNRMRRRCREALRTSLSTFNFQLSTDIQLLLSPRSSSLECPFGELLSDARAFLSFLTSHA